MHIARLTVCLWSALALFTPQPAAAQSEAWTGFRRYPGSDERVREAWLEGSVRAVLNAADDFDLELPTTLLIFATPNGNSIEETLGSRRNNDTDWHFDLQHIAAQTRLLRRRFPEENLVLAVIEAEGLSWPAWRRRQTDPAARITSIVETLRQWIPGDSTVSLAAHSGGGSFLWGFLNAFEEVPDWVDRFLFLDANYSFDDADGHGDKLLRWLQGDASRELTVLAYDDREITLNGNKVVGPDGGTQRATERMRTRFARDLELTADVRGPFDSWSGMSGQVAAWVHRNPDNRILHTALIGEMNGLIFAFSRRSDPARPSSPQGPRAYTQFVSPAPELPVRPPSARGGREILQRLAAAPLAEREETIVRELLSGNAPASLLRWRPIEFVRQDSRGVERKVALSVLPDDLAVGSDEDFVRVPLTPRAAQRIADAWGGQLPTRAIVDAIHAHADLRISPIPLTENREAPATFLEHHDRIQRQLGAAPAGQLLSGGKKSVVVTNRLGERPRRVAIYGWHQLDGTPIQPLTIVHHENYVDYSHGIRLVRREMTIDGRRHDVRRVAHDPVLHPLLSDEGPLEWPVYPGGAEASDALR